MSVRAVEITKEALRDSLALRMSTHDMCEFIVSALSAAGLLAGDESVERPLARVLCTCQGCGAVRETTPGTPHNCWRNEDGSYEEGGTFQ